MEKKSMKTSVAMAVAGAITVAGMMNVTQVRAEDTPADKVKCYGVAKKGQNSCHNASGSHGCAGASKIDYDGEEWIYVKSAAACLAQGGKLKPFKGVNPNKKK